MEWKQIETNGICYINSLEGSSNWYWGMDYTSGDLFEAEKLYQHADCHNDGRAGNDEIC